MTRRQAGEFMVLGPTHPYETCSTSKHGYRAKPGWEQEDDQMENNEIDWEREEASLKK